MKKKPKKSLGQNFLIDKNIIKKIVKIGNINNQNTTLEIGPGLGHLTTDILKKNPKKLYAIEKDEKLANFLKEFFYNSKNIEIINEDILDYIKKRTFEKNVIIFGNLPYNISTKILTTLALLKKWPPWYNMLIFMFQKEVADRIIANKKTKEFGRLSILCNWRFDIKKHFNVSKNSFSPRPKVDSTVLSFVPKQNNNFKLKDPKNLEMITRVLFSSRRKMINKNFSKLFKNHMGVANKLNLNLNKRPEEIDSEVFFKIAMMYEKLTH